MRKPRDYRSCETCCYAQKGDSLTASCHRFPPPPSEHYISEFPNVELKDWCGEWESDGTTTREITISLLL